MTRNDFNKLCEDIATEESNEDWNDNATLDRIRGTIGTVVIDSDFNSDNKVGDSVV